MAQPPNYPPPPQTPAPPKKSNTVLWVVIILGVGALCLFVMAIGAAILFPVFSQARFAAQKTACLSSVKQTSVALIMYSAENDDRYPAAAAWMDKSEKYGGGNFSCPAVKKDVGPQAYGFGFNDALSGKAFTVVKSPESTVSVFESADTSKNAHGGEGEVVTPGRHGGSNRGNNFGYADSHAKFVPDGTATHGWKP